MRAQRVASLLLLCCLCNIASGDLARPLFESDALLSVQILAPFDRIAEERSTTEYLQGQFIYVDQDGAEVQLDIGIRARGQYRRRADVCKLPPLRLNFRKSQVVDTDFSGQDKLKLVTHCQPGRYRYTQSVLSEYLAYRILNALSQQSFRVRLLEIQYIDTLSDSNNTEYGFLIEHQDALAARINAEPMTLERTSVQDLDREHLNLVSVFHYLIGNTDFAQTAGGADGECCHNHKLFGVDGTVQYSIPYDFDMAGLINAPYASPNPKLRLESVLERRYRGYCNNNDLLPATLELFRRHRDTIDALVESTPGLSERKKGEVGKYLREFYRTISSERRVRRYLESACR